MAFLDNLAPIVRTIHQATHSSSQGREATWCFREVILYRMGSAHLGLLPGVLKSAVVTWCRKESTWQRLSALWSVSRGRIVGVPSSPISQWGSVERHTALTSRTRHRATCDSASPAVSGQAPPPTPRFGTEEEPEMTAVEKSWDAMEPPEAWRIASSCKNFR